MCGRPAGWRVLADRARLGRTGSRLPLRASVAGLSGAYRGGRPPIQLVIMYGGKITGSGEEPSCPDGSSPDPVIFPVPLSRP